MNGDEWTGPFANERRTVERLLEEGLNEITYRSSAFVVLDNERGWTYVRNKCEYTSLDAVLDAIDKEVDR